jgi:hypothetical protein
MKVSDIVVKVAMEASYAVATDADFRAAERLLQLPTLPIIPGVRWVSPDEWEAGEPVTPINCDICGQSDDAPGDWNGETGCHLSCEDVSKNREVAYMKQKALLDEYRRIENDR